MITYLVRLVVWAVGGALLCYGFYQLHPPLAFIVGGALLIWESRDGDDAYTNTPES